jgi:hypothetical protein
MIFFGMFIPARLNKKSEPEPLSEVIASWLKENNLENRYLQTDIKMAWEEIMGPLIARHTLGISLENRILKIRVDNAPLRNQLFMSKAQILKKVNQRAGRQIALDCLIF